MARQRQYWVVSPNVKNNEKTIGAWKEEILQDRAAIMGWAPDEYGHGQMGPKFAGKTNRSIQRGDIVLIARRYHGGPDMVAFGVVKGGCRKARFRQPDDYAYQRGLQPFKPWGRAPQGIPLLDILPRNRALVQLHPETNHAHRKVCKWMKEQLGLEDTEVGNEGTTSKTTKVRPPDITEIDLPESTFGYEVKTKAKVTMARKVEAELLSDYRQWLRKQGRQLSAVKYNKLQCDGWEKGRRNLIEAKGSISREDIRMAVGQLFDYAFQGMKKFKQPHLAILLPDEPDADSIKWLAPLGIKIIWRRGRSFLDNANGQFTKGKPTYEL